MQGIETPLAHVEPDLFFKATRRQVFHIKTSPFQGFGLTDEVPLRQFGVVSGLEIRVSGSIQFGGTITGTLMSNRWPYGLLRGVRISANGQNQLISCNGIHLRALQMMTPTSEDRGVARNVRDVAVQNGTASFSSEDWGTSGANLLGPGRTVPAIGTYTFDLSFFVPIAFDQRFLTGALYASTSSTAIGLSLDWENLGNLFTLGGGATNPANLINYSVHEVVYEIPVVDGHPVLPDLSSFHGIVATRNTAMAQGDNEFTLPGTSAGRMLERVFFSVTSGTGNGPTGAAPLAINAANYGQIAWKYGGSGIPESVTTGQQLRYVNERQFNSDIGAVWGIACWDFANEWSLRDALNEGNYTDLRLLFNLANAPTGAFQEVVQETVFTAALAA